MDAIDQEQLIALGFMIFAATGLVHVGSRRSLAFALAGKGEIMGHADAAAFPITGSLMLFSLYVLLKLVPREALMWLLSTYLTLISVKSLATVIRPYIPGRANVVTGLAVVAVGVWYFRTNHWIANNLLAFAIAVVAIEAIQLKTFTVSSILLIGLFFYDIFWVFGTDVMVTVAKGIDGPIKLVFPQHIFGDWTDKTMLGLGDIVIPGFFISQMMRYSTTACKTRFFYIVALVAYVASLVNTMFVMVVFKHAQPALLYIVPWLLITALLAALFRGRLGALFAYDQEELKVSTEEMQKLGFVSASDIADYNDDIGEYEAELEEELLAEVLEIFGLDGPYRRRLVRKFAEKKKKEATEQKAKKEKPDSGKKPAKKKE